MAFQVSARSHPVAEMNITPLVDVMLVLLIIFMVATPLLSRPLMLDLPSETIKRPPPVDVVTLSIAENGQALWMAYPFRIRDRRGHADRTHAQSSRCCRSKQPITDYAYVASALGRAQRCRPGKNRSALNAREQRCRYDIE